EGIKPIPGVEAYHTKNKTLKGPEMENMRAYICKKYKITDKTGKMKKKAFNDFIKEVGKDFSLFDDLARDILKDYLMEEPTDLFDMMQDTEEQSAEEKIAEFKRDILSYLDYSSNFHLVLLAINNDGLKDLYQIVSDAHINGFYSDPRTDLKYIRDNGLGKNVIATSACLGGYLAKLVFQNRMDEAKAFIQE